jgi:NAD(P)-dependent dehydrogenase (short-subunit alcohol dehydrogenase family)
MTTRLGLEGRCAFVTGAMTQIVRRLREEGMTVSFTSGDLDHGESLARETGGSFIACDHRDRVSSDRALERALEIGGGRVEVLVTGSGMPFEGSIEETGEALFRELVERNVTSVFRVSRACFGPMRKQGGGSMILIASDAGIRAAHETAAYSITSSGVIAVAELFAAEGAPHGIRSNAVCPRAGTDVASLVAWLASDESAHMSGATLRVDDGADAAMVIDTRA